MSSWRAVSGFNYQLYDWSAAEALIGKHFDARTLTAFRACGVPAMQADFFRYCALYHLGGLYVDADTRALTQDINPLLAPARHGLLVKKQDRIANDVMFFGHHHDPLLERVIEIATRNIESRAEYGVWGVTGPGIMTGLFHDAQTALLFKPFVIKPIIKVKKFIHYQWEMDYKKDGEDWRDFTGETALSIYKTGDNGA